MLLLDIMGRHKIWRKIAKKERRRRKRTENAKERDSVIDVTSVEYQEWLKDQETLETMERAHINLTNIEENEKWLSAEIQAKLQWQCLQERKERLRIKHLEREAKLKLELELEEKRKQEEEQKLKEIEEQNLEIQKKFIEKLEQFLSGDAAEPPKELLVVRETKPNHEPCPFFTKTSCCRFGDHCSRNHQYPGISKVILVTNFYSHFGLENANFNEYDTDLMLEYEDSETYKDFKDFFYDVLPEFEKFGKVVQFKVCNNHEKHLRGNTYIEYSELRCALSAYRFLNGRWYGGKRLTLQFSKIFSWKKAICGLHASRRCPKGRSCNFLHVFNNPNNRFDYNYHNDENQTGRYSLRKTPLRPWRWSESPEVEVSRRKRSNSKERHKQSSKRREIRKSHRRHSESLRKSR